MAPLRVSLPARSQPHAVRPAAPKERTEVPIPDKAAWSDGDLSQMIGVSVPTLAMARRRLGLPFLMIGQRRLYCPGSVKAWLSGLVVTLPIGADDGEEADHVE